MPEPIELELKITEKHPEVTVSGYPDRSNSTTSHDFRADSIVK